MKRKLHKYILGIVLFVCFNLSFAVPVSAMNIWFPTTAFNQDEGEKLYTLFQIERVNEEYIGASGICNFDVSRDGTLAINFTNSHLNIYDKDGNFLYGYQFEVSGAHYAFFDTEDSQIIFYFLRDNCLVKVDDQGALLEICGAYDYSKNSDILDKQLQTKSRHYQEYEYCLDNIFLDSKYIRVGDTKLIRYDAQGEELVIYDGNKQYRMHLIAIAVLCWVFAVTCIGIVIIKNRHSSKFLYP